MSHTFISLATIKDQCRVAHSDDDDRLERFGSQAQAIVFDYLKVSEEAFAVGSPQIFILPSHIEAAMLLVVQELYQNNRHITTNEPIDPITVSVRSLLERSRDPTLA